MRSCRRDVPGLQGGKPSRSFGGLVLLGALLLVAGLDGPVQAGDVTGVRGRRVVSPASDRMATEAPPDKPPEEDQNQSEN
ncbi:hypothetical protein ACFU6I_07945 [Streptomyces sp. NPDC057486]|uniref:hypothetical protein n=1 Tax=Streptomyces sp. NPDC057486 TaxID=3346145 RepID=UPI0036741170